MIAKLREVIAVASIIADGNQATSLRVKRGDGKCEWRDTFSYGMQTNSTRFSDSE